MNDWVLVIAEYEALLRYIRQEHEDRKTLIQSAMSGKNTTHVLSEIQDEVVFWQNA